MCQLRKAEGASMKDVAAAVGDVPLSIARSFGTGVVDLAKNTVPLTTQPVARVRSGKGAGAGL